MIKPPQSNAMAKSPASLSGKKGVRCRASGRGNFVTAAALILLPVSLGLLAASSQPPDPAERMLNLATADQPLVHSAIVDAPVADVWKAFTTKEGITAWMVAAGEVDLRVGGSMRTSYTQGSDLTGPDVIVNTIISFDPMRMLSLKIAKAPERFPFKNAMQHVWTVLYFEPVEGTRTRVTCRMLGFTSDEESVRMRLFFQQGNQETLDHLVKHFAKTK
jgi:uncharacterized protein YndB with AHSA1/START domain